MKTSGLILFEWFIFSNFVANQSLAIFVSKVLVTGNKVTFLKIISSYVHKEGLLKPCELLEAMNQA